MKRSRVLLYSTQAPSSKEDGAFSLNRRRGSTGASSTIRAVGGRGGGHAEGPGKPARKPLVSVAGGHLSRARINSPKLIAEKLLG
jgi:hypothetical protein